MKLVTALPRLQSCVIRGRDTGWDVDTGDVSSALPRSEVAISLTMARCMYDLSLTRNLYDVSVS